MQIRDILSFSMHAATANRGRTLLMLLAMAIGVSSVVVLISLGDSARIYVIDQFSSLGTNLLIVLPGRSETTGGPPPLLGETPRDLTLEDAMALTRSRTVRRIAPIIAGSAPVSVHNLEREMLVLGSTSEIFAIRHLDLSQGAFLPPGDPTRAEALCVIGLTGKKSSLATSPPLAGGCALATAVSGLSGFLLRPESPSEKIWATWSSFRWQQHSHFSTPPRCFVFWWKPQALKGWNRPDNPSSKLSGAAMRERMTSQSLPRTQS